MGSSAVIKAVTYYLPRITQFSAIMNLSKGQHNLQVNVIAVSDYLTEGIIPFAQKEYIISANQSTKFNVNSNSDSTFSPTIDSIKSSYAIWQTSDSTPSPTPNPTPTANTLTPTPTGIEVDASDSSILNKTTLAEIVVLIVLVAVASISLVYFKRRKD
jgi:hypothetical protein